MRYAFYVTTHSDELRDATQGGVGGRQLYLCRNVAANCLVNIYTRPIIYLWQIEKVETLTSQI